LLVQLSRYRIQEHTGDLQVETDLSQPIRDPLERSRIKRFVISGKAGEFSDETLVEAATEDLTLLEC
jgi:hypothetical protein